MSGPGPRRSWAGGNPTLEKLGPCRVFGGISLVLLAILVFILQIVGATLGASGKMSAGCAFIAIATALALAAIIVGNCFGGCLCFCCLRSCAPRLDPNTAKDRHSLVLVSTICLSLAWFFFSVGLLSELAPWIHSAFYISKCRNSWDRLFDRANCEWAEPIVRSTVVAGIFYFKACFLTAAYLTTTGILYAEGRSQGQIPVNTVTTVYPMAMPMPMPMPMQQSVPQHAPVYPMAPPAFVAAAEAPRGTSAMAVAIAY